MKASPGTHERIHYISPEPQRITLSVREPERFVPVGLQDVVVQGRVLDVVCAAICICILLRRPEVEEGLQGPLRPSALHVGRRARLAVCRTHSLLEISAT